MRVRRRRRAKEKRNRLIIKIILSTLVAVLLILVGLFIYSALTDGNANVSTSLEATPKPPEITDQQSNSTSGQASSPTSSPTPTPSSITNSNQTSKLPIKPVVKQGLVKLLDLDDTFVIDQRYATENNFTGKKIYPFELCLVQENTAKKLISANNEFKKMGYKIKIFDAYRPLSAQQILWDAASNKSFVANPKKGSIHNRGTAIDLTLVDKDGKELVMPSKYDEFTERASIKYTGGTKKERENRELLAKVMVKHGFNRISHEWWHFQDTKAKEYPLRDLGFGEYLGE